jgi:hypothetical protein
VLLLLRLCRRLPVKGGDLGLDLGVARDHQEGFARRPPLQQVGRFAPAARRGLLPKEVGCMRIELRSDVALHTRQQVN